MRSVATMARETVEMITAAAHADTESVDAVTGEVDDALELELIAHCAVAIAAHLIHDLATATGRSVEDLTTEIANRVRGQYPEEE